MSNDALSTASLAAALKDLRAKRAKIDRAIEALEEVMGPLATDAGPSTTKAKIPRELASAPIGEASMWMLNHRGQDTPMSNREIADGLVAAGYRKKAEVENINAALHHRHDTKGDVIRRDARWHLVTAERVAETTEDATASPGSLNGAAEHTSP
jgi:hypothetical protein